MQHFGEGTDVGARTSALLRERLESLAGDVGASISTLGPMFDQSGWHAVANVLVRLFATSVESGAIDVQSPIVRELERCSPPLTTRALLDALHQTERLILDELALDQRLGATSEPWAMVAHTVRRATIEILGAHAEYVAGQNAHVRDGLTTLIASPVLELALEQEIERAIRHHHALALLLFDIDDLSEINREYGWGVGDRLLERTGISARRFFRTHDWVARHGGDAIAVLLPETTLDQAAVLAARFREMVESRLMLHDHNTEALRRITVSAAAIGTDLVQAEIEPGYVLAEAEAAVLRAKLAGRNRVERVALAPTSLTIFGAATMLGQSARDIARLIREGTLKAARRGRHYHIDRVLIDEYRRGTRDEGRGSGGS